MKHRPLCGAGTLTLEPDGTATGCNPVQVGSTPTDVSAMRANREEQETGKFSQSRYRAVRLMDEESLLACTA